MEEAPTQIRLTSAWDIQETLRIHGMPGAWSWEELRLIKQLQGLKSNMP